MSGLVKGSTELGNSAAASHAANLLCHYSFELDQHTVDQHTVDQVIATWLETYSINWVRLAIIEALYQGRYKTFSVGQILAFWQRRGQPLPHFNHEFEHLVCDRFPRNLALLEEGRSESHQTEKKYFKPGRSGYESGMPPVKGTQPQTIQPEEHQASNQTSPHNSISANGEVASDPSTLENSDSEVASPQTNQQLEKNPDPESSLFLPVLEILVPGLGFAKHSIKPKLSLQLTAALYQPNWLSGGASKHPIHQFTPVSESSDFYSKLKAVAKPMQKSEK